MSGEGGPGDPPPEGAPAAGPGFPPEGDPKPEGGFHAAAFRLLLRLYPRPFVRAYGEEMTELFRRRLVRARRRAGWRGVVGAWARAVSDVVRTAAAERLGRPGRGAGARGAGRPAVNELGNGGDTEMETLLQDVRHALRRLARTPIFTASAVAILALGIGANTAAFSVVDALLFRPPPFERPEEVVWIYQDSDDGRPSSTSFPAYRDIAAMDGVFAGVAAESPGSATWETEDGARGVEVVFTTSSLLPTLGLTPFRGRWFSPEHDEVGGPPVAVVSHRTWRREMGADPGVIGRTIRLNGEPVTVIGVGPERYAGSAGALVTDFWLSISATPVGGPFRVANLERREDHWYLVIARLAPGVALPQARSAMDGLAARLAEAYPDLNRNRGITVFPLDEVRFHPDVDGALRSAGVGLLAVVGLVLLLACGNLSNLLLVRGMSRASETAVRKALGASTGRIVRLFLVEATLLCLVGSAAGLLLAAWLVTLVPGLPLPLPGGMDLDVALDGRVLLFATGLALATGALFGLAPALRSARADVASAIREGAAGTTGGRSTRLFRDGLVAVQVAISVVLVVGAGLLVRSLDAIRSVDPGVDVERVAFAGTDLVRGGVTGDEGPVVVEEILRRVEALPGVDRAGATSRLPVEAGPTSTQVVEGFEPPAGTGALEIPVGLADPGYFETMGISLVDGRTFGPDDGPESPIVVVVNRTAAERFWGGDAVGGRVRPQGVPDGWRSVVGVVEDVKVSALGEPPTPRFYYAMAQYAPTSFTVVARTAGDPATLLPAIRGEIRAVRPALPLTRMGTLESHLGDALLAPRAVTVFVGAFSLLALLLATVGVYGVVSFTVGRRTAEMGVRIALGAARRRLVGMVVGESLVTVALGIVAGVGLALLAVPDLEGILFGVEALDPATFAGSVLLLLAVTAVAAWLPARRASRVDPVRALRAE